MIRKKQPLPIPVRKGNFEDLCLQGLGWCVCGQVEVWVKWFEKKVPFPIPVQRRDVLRIWFYNNWGGVSLAKWRPGRNHDHSKGSQVHLEFVPIAMCIPLSKIYIYFFFDNTIFFWFKFFLNRYLRIVVDQKKKTIFMRLIATGLHLSRLAQWCRFPYAKELCKKRLAIIRSKRPCVLWGQLLWGQLLWGQLL